MHQLDCGVYAITCIVCALYRYGALALRSVFAMCRLFAMLHQIVGLLHNASEYARAVQNQTLGTRAVWCVLENFNPGPFATLWHSEIL